MKKDSVSLRNLLTEKEQAIEDSIIASLERKKAFMVIRANSLLVQDYQSFDDYCLKRWGCTSRSIQRR